MSEAGSASPSRDDAGRGPAAGRGIRRPRAFHHVAAYALSLPERLLRTILGLLGGVALAFTRILPRPLREGRLFRIAVQRQIKLLTDDVGQARIFTEQRALDARSAARMGLGGAVDNLLILTLHASPVWILLAATDVCEGAHAFMQELGAELKEAGVIEKGSRLDNVDDVLGGLARLSSRMADTLDMPPISLEDMKATVQGLREQISDVTGTASQTADLDGLVADLRDMARTSGRSLLSITAAVATGAMRSCGNLIAGTARGASATVRIVGRRLWTDVVLDYAGAADTLRRQGFYGSLRRFLRPHARAYRRLFSYRFLTFTEIILSLGSWRKARWRR